MPSNNPTARPEWKALTAHATSLAATSMRDLFAQSPGRFKELSLSDNGLFFDYSRQPVTAETMKLLTGLARSSDIENWRDKMFAGEKINLTENRAVLHTALRRPKADKVAVDGADIMPFIHGVLDQMKNFSDAVRSGSWKGHTGKPIRDIINIGIGGSDLGPHMACEALKHLSADHLTFHFVSNVDGAHIHAALQRCNPETTLVIVASKTFTTQETMANASTAKKWLVKALGDEAAVAKHFAALSTNQSAVEAFGIAGANMFPFGEWVGGRYSMWSAIGLPVAIAIGFDNFRKMLDGAASMDNHFRSAPLEKNIPVVMAMLGIWQRNFHDISDVAVIPYDARLSLFPSYLQQLDMESNGKSVDREGNPITDYQTGPAIFGAPGTDAQHSFFQKLHQGTDTIAIDFIAACNPDHPYKEHHDMLLSNMAAQGQAFMQGRTADETGGNPHRLFSGNRPVNTILVDRLDAFHLGQLVALYEHKVFVQGIVWNINSYDQFGVELGKEMAQKIAKGETSALDGTTRGILDYVAGTVRKAA